MCRLKVMYTRHKVKMTCSEFRVFKSKKQQTSFHVLLVGQVAHSDQSETKFVRD